MLDNNVKPIHYNLEVDVNLKNFVFRGRETIRLEVGEVTNKIVLHAVDLKIKRCVLKRGEEEIKPRVKMDKKNEEMVLTFNKSLVLGKAELFIEFQGALAEMLSGFYRSKYVHRGKTKYLATTQFEPADARRAFPCFDEPASKATFDITLVVDKKLTAISNMPVAEEKREGAKKRVVFQTTPPMSTYLVYLGVGEFEFAEDKLGDTVIRVATTPGKTKHAAFALDNAKKFLEYYNAYFGISYPLPKLDMIAIPDFSAGAMENWGAITYREASILFDPKVGSTAAKMRVAQVIAHELAHQWFGDLVTMQWWDDLWLNESFANWIEYKAQDHFYPQWDLWSVFLEAETVGAMGTDSLRSTHSIQVHVEKPHELSDLFDPSISYQKGSCIIRMLENHLGEDKFREGLRKYVANSKYGNAKTEDLWAALEVVSNVDVRKMMDGWVKQAGYPVIKVQLDGSTLFLEQQRYFTDPPEKPDEVLWAIPVTIELYSGKTISFVMRERSKYITLEERPPYVKVNKGHTGFYRVAYTPELLGDLKKRVSDKRLNNLDRWGIQNDLYAQARACMLPVRGYLDFIEAFENEDDYLACQGVASSLYALYALLQEPLRGEVVSKALPFYRKVIERLGWDPKPDENENDSILRASVLVYMGRMGEASVVQEALRRFREFLKTREIHPDLRGPVYSLAAWGGDKKTYKTLYRLFKKTDNPHESRRVLIAMGGFGNPDILQDVMKFSLSQDVRPQDTYLPLAHVSMNPAGRDLVWPWTKKNWGELRRRYGKGANMKMLDAFIEYLAYLSDLEKMREVEAFFKKNAPKGTEKAVERTLERIRINARFLEYNTPS